MAKGLKKKTGTWLSRLQTEESKKRIEITSNLFLLLVLGLSISLLLTLYLDQLPQNIVVGAIATKDIKADQNYEIVDEKLTQKLRMEAAQAIRPVYDFDPSIEMGASKKIVEAFDGARTFLQENTPKGSNKFLLPDDLEAQMKNEFQERIGGNFREDQYDFLRKFQFSISIERALVYMIHDIMQYPMIHTKSELELIQERGFVLRRLSQEEPYAEELIYEIDNFIELEQAHRKLSEFKAASLKNEFNLEFLTNDSFKLMKELSDSLIKVNVTYNGLETDLRKQKAQNNIKDSIIKLKRGESVIRSGDRFEAWHITVIEGIRLTRIKSNRILKFLGIFIFVNLVLTIVYYYSAKYIKKFRPGRKDLIFLGVTLIFFVMLLRFGVFLASSMRDSLPITVGISMLYYAIPIAGGAMLVRFILNSETALIFAVILSLFSGIFLENNLEMTVYYLISGVFAAHAIAHVDKRSAVLLCGAYTGLVNALTIYSLNLISLISVSDTIQPVQILLNAVSGFFGGLFTAMIVLVLTAVAEVIFSYTTDIKLLELANLSHPLLKEMIVRAPGTYHHSQIVGILAEAGAGSIDANPLLARVASYYHDIGKMKKPQYFIENQSGINPHDKLTPSMSALIVEAHVKDGLEMARANKLPKKISDMIPEHQGTKLIGFFYDKAKQHENPSLGRADERDYRYPGPKPQTREAGILMLADTIEAAVRSLPEKTPTKIRTTVEKLVNNHFVDEQLDDCDLTLRDLHRIVNAFVKILVGIYHQRVEYPDKSRTHGADVHQLNEKTRQQNDITYQQRASAESNIAPLFRKKNKEDSSSSGEI